MIWLSLGSHGTSFKIWKKSQRNLSVSYDKLVKWTIECRTIPMHWGATSRVLPRCNKHFLEANTVLMLTRLSKPPLRSINVKCVSSECVFGDHVWSRRGGAGDERCLGRTLLHSGWGFKIRHNLTSAKPDVLLNSCQNTITRRDSKLNVSELSIKDSFTHVFEGEVWFMHIVNNGAHTCPRC